MHASIRKEQILCKMSSLYYFLVEHILHNRVIIHLTGLQSSSPELQNNGVVKKNAFMFHSTREKVKYPCICASIEHISFLFFLPLKNAIRMRTFMWYD